MIDAADRQYLLEKLRDDYDPYGYIYDIIENSTEENIVSEEPLQDFDWGVENE